MTVDVSRTTRKARDRLPLAESISGFHEFSNPPDANKPPSETVRSLGGLFALLTNT